MQRFDGRRLWLHCICCHMTLQPAHKHNPRSNLFGSFIVSTTHILTSAEMASLYLVFSQQRSCGNAALIQHTAHTVSRVSKNTIAIVSRSPWFSSSALGLMCRVCRLQLILLRYNSLTVHPLLSIAGSIQGLSRQWMEQPCWYLFNTPRVHSPP